jgi:hypothetical protein
MKNNYFRLFSITILFLVFGFSILNAQVPFVSWAKSYNGPANLQDSSVAVCVNGNGQVFVTGWTYSAASLQDIVTLCYNPNTGDTVWVKRIVSPLSDKPLAMTCDNNAVYVTGWTFNPSSGRDVITIKYNAATGDTTWIKRYNGTGNGGDYGIAIAVDAAGNVYSAGRTDIGGSQKFSILKYDINGNVPSGWPVVYINGISTSFDEAHGVKVDGSGNVYVAGQSGPVGASDFMTLKINSAGSVQWVKKYNGTSNQEDNAVSLELDNTAANIYVGGWGYRAASIQDFVVVKYSSNGDSLGIAFYTGPANQIDILTAMTIDASNNVYVTGYSEGVSTSFDYATIKYNSNLAQQWVARTTDAGFDIPDAICVGDTNSVYVTGSSIGSGTGYDYLTIKYRSDGSESWRRREFGSSNTNDYASSIAFFDVDHVYVTGSANFTPPGSTVFYTLRYSNLVGIEPISSVIPDNFVLSQNYPNPFNPNTTIKFDIPKESFIKVAVYNVMGQELEVLVNQQVKAGEYKVTWNASKYASGIYFYKLISSGFVETRKMMLIK